MYRIKPVPSNGIKLLHYQSGLVTPKELSSQQRTHNCGKALIQKRYNTRRAGTSISTLYAFGAAAGAGLVGVGTVAYSYFDEGFRRNIEQQLPPAKTFFDTLFGELKDTRQVSESKAAGGSASRSPAKSSPKEAVPFSVLDQPGVSQIDIAVNSIVDKSLLNESGAAESKAAPSVATDPEVVKQEPVEVPYKEEAEVGLDIPAEAGEPTSKVSSPPEISVMEEAKDTSHVEGLKMVSPPEGVVASNDADKDVVQSLEEDHALDQSKPLLAPILSISSENSVMIAELEVLVDDAERHATEAALEASVSELNHLADDAIRIQHEAAASIREYMRQLSAALTTPEGAEHFQEAWQSASASEHVSKEAVERSLARHVDVLSKIDSLLGIVQKLRAGGSNHGADRAADVSADVALRLSKAAEEVKRAAADFALMQDYQSLLQRAKDSFKKDLTEFAPDLVRMIDERQVAHSGQALNPSEALLAFALKKAEFLVAEIEKEKSREQERLRIMLEKQRAELEVLAQHQTAEEVNRLRQELDLQRQRREAEITSQYEQEMRVQLKRQANAHREHLADVLSLLEKDLADRHAREMSTALHGQQMKFEGELEERLHFLKGVEDKMRHVVELEDRQRNVQELWIASQSLSAALESERDGGKSRSLLPELLTVINIGKNSAVVAEMVGSIAQEAAAAGVSSEKELLRRFNGVRSACKKVAAVGEEGGSLWVYAWSYLRSVFVFSRATKDSVNELLDVENLTTYELLDKAEYCVLHGDLEQATRFMSQLRGVARKLSSDWIREARLYLETKQTVQFLLAYAAAQGIVYE